mmetsp:Transcript_5680/g.5035  ORF Transcript_5680/g.5035 Transcript_5680/m.5035 type:complete len:251 (-) Transcript_5680:643-1395(-)
MSTETEVVLQSRCCFCVTCGMGDNVENTLESCEAGAVQVADAAAAALEKTAPAPPIPTAPAPDQPCRALASRSSPRACARLRSRSASSCLHCSTLASHTATCVSFCNTLFCTAKRLRCSLSVKSLSISPNNQQPPEIAEFTSDDSTPPSRKRPSANACLASAGASCVTPKKSSPASKRPEPNGDSGMSVVGDTCPQMRWTPVSISAAFGMLMSLGIVRRVCAGEEREMWFLCTNSWRRSSSRCEPKLCML